MGIQVTKNFKYSSSANQGQAVIAYVALGSNLGDREQHLMHAIERLQLHPDVEVLNCSGIYETDPVGYTDQPAFLNMAIRIATVLAPHDLLHLLLHTELALGRVREVRWGPRCIDLDLLLYDKIQLDDEDLTIPHPRMMERAFVLVPLLDVLDEQHELHAPIAPVAREALQGRKEGILLWKTVSLDRECGHFVN